jgi:ubiquinone/menaquinone biosynthesis C-methylase UbiE
MEYKTQVQKSHYSFEKYFYLGRWVSYWHQAKEITSRLDISSVLDIGPGTEFLKATLQIHRPDITYKTVDVAPDISPDIIASVTKLPLPDQSFDVVCAFQVLEHIQFSDFETALQEMVRVSKKYVFISLPHFGPSVEWLIKIPFLPRVKWAIKIPFPKTHVFGGQHYWEIGKKGYSAKKIRSLLEEQTRVISEYVPFEHQYHHFYILEKK